MCVPALCQQQEVERTVTRPEFVFSTRANGKKEPLPHQRTPLKPEEFSLEGCDDVAPLMDDRNALSILFFSVLLL